MRGFANVRFGHVHDPATLPVLRRVNLATLGDFPPVFAAWVAAVKYLGGVPVVWPPTLADVKHAGQPAARYDATTYAALVNAKKISRDVPQSASKSGYVYVLAPAAVVSASKDLPKVTAAEEAALPRESLLDRFIPGASRYAKLAAAGGALLVGLKVLDFFGVFDRRRSRG